MTQQWAMPIVQPVRIDTHNQPWYKCALAWLWQARAWELVQDYHCEVYGQRIMVPAGFRTDFASVPRIFWPIMSPTGVLLIPGLLHDFYYRHHFLIAPDHSPVFALLGRSWGDNMLQQVCTEVNGMVVASAVAWSALRVGGGIAWNSARKKDFDRGANLDLKNGY
jgi:hypothetical protein